MQLKEAPPTCEEGVSSTVADSGQEQRQHDPEVSAVAEHQEEDQKDSAQGHWND